MNHLVAVTSLTGTPQLTFVQKQHLCTIFGFACSFLFPSSMKKYCSTFLKHILFFLSYHPDVHENVLNLDSL